jgi:hypothetical protein
MRSLPTGPAQFAGDIVLADRAIRVRVLPTLGHQVEIFENNHCRRQCLGEMIDSADMLDSFDDDNGGFTGDTVDEAFDGGRFAVAGRTGQAQGPFDGQSFRFEHFTVADRGGNEIEFGPHLSVRNKVGPGPRRRS